MKEGIKLITEIVNMFHDMIVVISDSFGLYLTDKQLHFWVIGVIGIILLLFAETFFKLLSKWSITSIAFIYTLTVLLVIVFAIEIQQKITGRGNMEFADVVVGLYGFFAFSFVYLIIKYLFNLIKKRFINKR